MTQPFEFKNPLDGVPRPLENGTGKNPFADDDAPLADLADDNIFATSAMLPPESKPEYVTILTHRGPRLLCLAITCLMIGVTSGVVAIWQPILAYVLLADGVLAIALLIKASQDLRAMRAGAMHDQGRSATRAAWALSVATIVLTVPAAIWTIGAEMGWF